MMRKNRLTKVGELFGMKVYVDPDLPPDRVRLIQPRTGGRVDIVYVELPQPKSDSQIATDFSSDNI